MRNPTTIAERRLKKLTRYLRCTSEVYQANCLDPHAETLQVPVDIEWADDKETRQSSSSLSRMRSAHIGTHTEDKSSSEYRGRVVRHRLRSNLRLGSITTFARMEVQNSTASSDRLTECTCGVQVKRARSNLLQTDSQSALAVCKRRGPGRMKHIELKMLAVQEWLKTGQLRTHKVSTRDNPADLMTKAMTREKMIKFGRALNLRGSFFTDLDQLAQ